MDAEPAVLRGYVEVVLACIACLRPAVVYLHYADFARALRGVCAARGDWWEAYQV